MKNRDIAFDITKGIGILLMIIGHLELPLYVRNFIFSFHMPLFLILSGYFYKIKDSGTIIKSGLKLLVKPYLITALGCIALSYIISPEYALTKVWAAILGSGGGHFFFDDVPVMGPIWFLLALFWCRIIYNFIFKRFAQRTILICLFISMVSFAFGKYVMCLPLGFLYGLCSLIFYSIGHYWKTYNFTPSRSFLIVGVLVWIVCIYFAHLEMALYSSRLYPISYFAAFIGTYVTYLLAKRTPLFLHSIMLWLGQNTLLILCYHTLYFFIYGALLKDIFPLNYQQTILCFVISLGFPFIHVLVMRKLFSSKDNH